MARLKHGPSVGWRHVERAVYVVSYRHMSASSSRIGRGLTIFAPCTAAADYFRREEASSWHGSGCGSMEKDLLGTTQGSLGSMCWFRVSIEKALADWGHDRRRPARPSCGDAVKAGGRSSSYLEVYPGTADLSRSCRSRYRNLAATSFGVWQDEVGLALCGTCSLCDAMQ